MLYDRVALEKPIYKATRAERIQIANDWILTASSEGGTQLPLNQQPDFAQAKRECKRLHDEHLTRTNKNTEIFLAVTKEDSEKGNNFEGYEDFAYVVDPNKGWRFYRQSRGNCRHLRQARRPTCKQLRHRHRRGTKPSGRRTIGILSILQVLTSADFSHSWDRFRLLGEKNLQPTDGVCEQYSHKHSTYRVAHSMITFHDANTRGSSSRIAHLCVHKSNCHPRVMSHLPLFASSPIFPGTSQTPTTLLEHDEHLGPCARSHCDDLR